MGEESGKRVSIRISPNTYSDLTWRAENNNRSISVIVRGCVRRMSSVASTRDDIWQIAENMDLTLSKEILSPGEEIHDKTIEIPRITVRLTDSNINYVKMVAKTLGIRFSSALRLIIVWCLNNWGR